MLDCPTVDWAVSFFQLGREEKRRKKRKRKKRKKSAVQRGKLKTQNNKETMVVVMKDNGKYRFVLLFCFIYHYLYQWFAAAADGGW